MSLGWLRMKVKILVVLALIGIFLCLTPGAQALTEDLEVVLTSQNPYPVEPGQVVSIEVALQNTGYGEGEDVIFEINPGEPFSLVPGQETVKTFTRVPARDQVTTSYKLHVDQEAVSGNYDLEFLFYTTGEVRRTDEVTIQVQGNPKLVLDSIEATPEDMKPGDTVDLTAMLKNLGTGSASFMEASLSSNTTYILPVLSGGLHYVGEIEPGETKEVKFRVSVDNEAEYKTYSGTLTLSYKDDSGASQTSSFSVGFPVRGYPVIEVLSAKMDNSDFKVDIENIGTATAKALKVELVQNGEVRDSSIANELKPSRHKTFRFRGFTMGEAFLNITYLDQKNDFFTNEIQTFIKPSAYSEDAQGGGISPLAPILLVIVVLETYYIWRVRKRLKKR